MEKPKPALNAFGLGLGLALGIILGRRISTMGRIAQLPVWERAAAKRFGIQRSALLMAKVEARFEELFAGRPRFRNSALRSHLEKHILPGIALYQVLRQELKDQAEALTVLDECLSAEVMASNLQTQARLIDHLPGGFTILRLALRVIMRTGYPEQGWHTEWVENNPERVAFNITDCFYLNVFRSYGVPELTAHFCAGDDQLYESMKTIEWGRTETLGRGDARCNFAFSPRLREARGDPAMSLGERSPKQSRN